jgi:nitrogen fixation NifU-like protein
MTEALKGMAVAEFERLFGNFHSLVTGKAVEGSQEELGKLVVFSGVSQYPVRVKCATLPWHTLRAALNQAGRATTE